MIDRGDGRLHGRAGVDQFRSFILDQKFCFQFLFNWLSPLHGSVGVCQPLHLEPGGGSQETLQISLRYLRLSSINEVKDGLKIRKLYLCEVNQRMFVFMFPQD